MVERGPRRFPSPASLGLIAALSGLALLTLWWLLGRPARPGGAGSAGEAPPGAEAPLPEARGPVSRFERSVMERLRTDRPRTAPLRGSLRITLDSVDWRGPRDGRFLRASRVTGRLSLDELLRGNGVVTDVSALEPQVWLDRPPGDTIWNWQRVLAAFLGGSARKGSERSTLPPLVEVRGLVVRRGFVSIRQPAFEARLLDLQANVPRITFAGPGLPAPIVRVADAVATFVRPDRGWVLPFTARDATVTFPDSITRFAVAEAAFGHSRLTGIQGIYDASLPGLGVRATGRAPELVTADLQTFASSATLMGSASFDWSLEPTNANGVLVGVTALRYTSSGSVVTGAISVSALADTGQAAIRSADLRLHPLNVALVDSMMGSKLPYSGEVTGRVTGSGGEIRFDLAGNLRTPGAPPFNVAASGAASFTSAGAALRNAVLELRSVPLAALRPVAPGLTGRGTVAGRVTVTGAAGRVPLAMDARLALAGGTATVHGTVTPGAAPPSYDLAGTLQAIRLRDLLSSAPPASLSADFSLRGSGFSPESADAAFRLTGRFAGWKTDANDRLVARGSIRGGVLRLDTLSAGLASASLEAGGTWPFAGRDTAALAYRLELATLQPFTPYLPVPAGPTGGSVQVAGTVSGPLKAPHLAGGFALRSAEAAGWRVGRGEGTFALRLGGARPEGRVGLQARDVTTPAAGSFDNITGSVSLLASRLEATASAERPDGGRAELTASGFIPPEGERTVTVSHLLADVAGHRWQLLQPSVIRWVPGGVLAVQDLRLQENDGPGRLALNGTLLPADSSRYRLEAEKIPVADFYGLLGRPSPVTGLLDAAADVRGPAAAPAVTGSFTLSGGTVEGVGLDALQGTLQYDAGRLTADARATLAEGGAVVANASLPVTLELGLPPRGTLAAAGPVQGSLVADTVPLSLLGSLTSQVTDVTGLFSARMTLAGTADRPVLSGSATLRGGALRLPAANQTYDNIAGTLTLRDRRIQVDSLTARSDGTVVLTGAIDFPQLRNPVADLALTFDRFRPLGTADQPQAAVWGRLTATGPLLGPTVRGSIRLDDGNLMIPAAGATSDLTGEAEALGLSGTPGAGAEAVPAAPVSDRVRLEGVQVQAGSDLWFQTEDARVQLGGLLTVDRGPSAGMRIVGTLEGQRGTYTVVAGLFVRRLDISQARIRFLGTTELNPQIDIVATKTVLTPSSSAVDIQAHVTGTLENPRLSLSTAQGVQIPESELLSFLVFGQPSFALGNGTVGQTLLRQTLAGGLTELASMQLEQSLTASGLPLDVLEVQASAAGTPENLVVGRELAPDVFLTVQTAIGALFGNAGQSTGEPVALRIQWRTTPRLTTTLGWEPTNRAQVLYSFFANLPQQQISRPNQITLELRRRWSY